MFGPRGNRKKNWRSAAAAGSLALIAVTGAVSGVHSETRGYDGTLTLSGSYLAAQLADRERDIDEAARSFRAALAIDPDDLYLLNRATIYTVASGDLETGMTLARQLTKAEPDSRVGRIGLAVNALGDKQYAEVSRIVDQSKASALTRLTGALIKAWSLYGRGKVDEAIALLDEVEGDRWFEPFTLYHAGLIAAAGRKPAVALDRLRRAYDIDSDPVRVAEAYMGALARSGRRDEAMAVADAYLERYPGNPLIQRMQQSLIAGNAAPPLTVRTAQEGGAEALVGLGAALSRDDTALFSAFFLRLGLHLDEDSGSGFGHMALGDLLFGNGQIEKAIEVYDEIDRNGIFGRVALVRSAQAYERLERYGESQALFERAVEEDERDLESIAAFGNMLRGQKKFPEAAKVFSKGIALIDEKQRRHWTLYYFRGIAFERTKQWSRAEADFKQALELYPNQPLVLNYLGYSWVDRGEHLEEALDMLIKAVELRPNDGYIIDSLGWAYYKLGRYKDAVTYLERAALLKPSDPVINDHLGDAYWRVGRKREAQFQWRHARDLGAEEPERAMIIRKIQEGRLIGDDPAEKKTEAEPAPVPAVYKVQAGESLWDIAVRNYGRGSAYRTIFEANRDRLEAPDALRPGMELRLP